MSRFDSNTYLTKVMRPAVNAGVLPDYFARYCLPLDADQADIEKALEDVYSFWNQQRRHKKYGSMILALIGEHGDIQSRLRDPVQRLDLRAQAEEQLRRQQRDRFKDLDKTVERLFNRKGCVTPGELDVLLRQYTPQGLTRDEIVNRLNALNVLVREPEPSVVIQIEEGLEEKSRAEIRKAINDLNMLKDKRHPELDYRDLFDFLGESPGASKQNLEQAYKKCSSEWERREATHHKTAAEELLRKVSEYLVRGDPDLYRKSLVYEKCLRLRPDVELFAVDGDISVDESSDLLAKADELGLDRAVAKSYITGLALEFNVKSINWPAARADEATRNKFEGQSGQSKTSQHRVGNFRVEGTEWSFEARDVRELVEGVATDRGGCYSFFLLYTFRSSRLLDWLRDLGGARDLENLCTSHHVRGGNETALWNWLWASGRREIRVADKVTTSLAELARLLQANRDHGCTMMMDGLLAQYFEQVVGRTDLAELCRAPRGVNKSYESLTQLLRALGVNTAEGFRITATDFVARDPEHLLEAVASEEYQAAFLENDFQSARLHDWLHETGRADLAVRMSELSQESSNTVLALWRWLWSAGRREFPVQIPGGGAVFVSDLKQIAGLLEANRSFALAVVPLLALYFNEIQRLDLAALCMPGGVHIDDDTAHEALENVLQALGVPAPHIACNPVELNFGILGEKQSASLELEVTMMAERCQYYVNRYADVPWVKVHEDSEDSKKYRVTVNSQGLSSGVQVGHLVWSVIGGNTVKVPLRLVVSNVQPQPRPTDSTNFSSASSQATTPIRSPSLLPNEDEELHSRYVVALIAFLFGFLGVHRFYTRRIPTGFFYVIFSALLGPPIPLLISWFEALYYIVGFESDEAFNRTVVPATSFSFAPGGPDKVDRTAIKGCMGFLGFLFLMVFISNLADGSRRSTSKPHSVKQRKESMRLTSRPQVPNQRENSKPVQDRLAVLDGTPWTWDVVSDGRNSERDPNSRVVLRWSPGTQTITGQGSDRWGEFEFKGKGNPETGEVFLAKRYPSQLGIIDYSGKVTTSPDGTPTILGKWWVGFSNGTFKGHPGATSATDSSKELDNLSDFWGGDAQIAAIEMLRHYYELIDQDRFSEAYEMRSQRSRNETSRTSFIETWSNNRSIRAENLQVASQKATRALVSLRLVADDFDTRKGGNAVTTYTGKVKLVLENSSWRYDGGDFQALRTSESQQQPVNSIFGAHWGVIIGSIPNHSSAEGRAATLLSRAKAQGFKASLIESSKYPSLQSGYLVVLAGTFSTESAAVDCLAMVRDQGWNDAYIKPLQKRW